MARALPARDAGCIRADLRAGAGEPLSPAPARHIEILSGLTVALAPVPEAVAARSGRARGSPALSRAK